jgi:hypothetical protein
MTFGTQVTLEHPRARCLPPPAGLASLAWLSTAAVGLVVACGRPAHQPLEIDVSGTVLNVGMPDQPFDGVAAGAEVSIVEVGVVFLGDEVPRLGQGLVARDGAFTVADVDVSLAGIESPLLAIVDDRDTTSGPLCDGVRLGAVFPTLSGVLPARPKNEKQAIDVANALVFVMPTFVARLLTGVVAVGDTPVSVEELLCSRGFIFGVVAEMNGDAVSPVAGAVVTAPALVDDIVYLQEAADGMLEPAAGSATTEIGAFVAWYREDASAASSTDLTNFQFAASTASGQAFTGFGFALPRFAFVAGLLPTD